jgi:hypothetical protein
MRLLQALAPPHKQRDKPPLQQSFAKYTSVSDAQLVLLALLPIA